VTTIAEVRAALATAASLDACPIYEHPSDVFDAPGGYVTRMAYDPRLVFSGSKFVVPFRVWVCVSGADPVAAGVALDPLIDLSAAVNVPAAIQDEANWPDQLIDYAEVVQIGELTEVRQEVGDKYFGIPIDVEVCW
jgi:hypothetical protein